MKTLNEVIEAIEICEKCSECLGSCDGCAYLDKVLQSCDHSEANHDAIHYLKQYRRLLENDEAENKSMTWNELIQMHGKPVWLEFLRIGFTKTQWVVVESIKELSSGELVFVCFGQRWKFKKSDMGIEWWVYRKERK